MLDTKRIEHVSLTYYTATFMPAYTRVQAQKGAVIPSGMSTPRMKKQSSYR